MKTARDPRRLENAAGSGASTATKLRQISLVAGAVTALLGALAIVGVVSGHPLIPVYPRTAAPPTPFVSVAIFGIGAGLLALEFRPGSSMVRRVVVVVAAVLLIGSLTSLATRLLNVASGPVLGALHVTRTLGGVTFALAAAALLLVALGRTPFVSGLLGLIVTAIGFVICLGFIYGGPLLMGVDWVPASLASTVSAFVIGASLITAGGPNAWPNRLFIGDSVQAMMFRWLIPLMALAIIVTDLATVDLFNRISHALGSALNTVITISVTLVVVSYLGRIIGARLERANASLRESEQRFTRVFKSVPAGLAISRTDDGRFLEINDAFERICGWSRDEVVGKRSTDIGLWVDSVDREAYVRRVSQSGGALAGQELKLRAKDGRPLVIQTSAQIVEFQGHEVLLSSFIDVTDQRQAEAALQLSELKFGTIFRESPVALTVSEFDTGRLVEVNAAYLWHCGASSAAEVLGKTTVELGVLTPEDRERNIMGPMVRGQTTGLVTPARSLRGEPRMSELSLTTYEVDGRRFILTSTIDITDRLKAERDARMELAERRRLQRRLDLALRAGGIGTWELNRETREFQADDLLVDLYGIPRDANGVVAWDAWAARVHPDDFSQVTEQLIGLQGGAQEVFADFRVVRPDGGLRYVHSVAAMLPADEERPARVVGVNIDVTRQKLAELELRKHRDGLEMLVASRTAELRAAKEAAESASRAKGAFLAHMSHEIRTPMNAILGYAQLLKGDATLDTDQRRKVTAIHTSGDHLLGLLNDILEMSRIEAGRLQLSVQPFDLHALLDGVRSMFMELTSQRGQRFSVLIPPNVVRGLESDPGKIRQVLINLLGNATKFTERGGIAVRVASENAGDERHIVTIAVEDTGPGIADEDQAMIFAAFGQTETGRMRSGTGLGLTISRSMAQLLGGDLTVASAVGRGSTFTFTFGARGVPDVALPGTSHPRGPQRLDPAEKRRRVLVVDDVPSNRELLEESLSRAGFETRGAVSGEQAIEMHHTWSPDLVLMDLHMPGMGGLAAIKILRAADTQSVIVVTTAGAGDGTEATVIAAGAVGMLRKPYRESELFETIGRAMGVSFIDVGTAAAPERISPTADLGSLSRGIPADLIAELREASKQARAARLVQLADRVAEHSGPAADAIRELANGFRYRALIDALDGANGKS